MGRWQLGDKLFDQYEILRIIDEGGMGTVYVALDHDWGPFSPAGWTKMVAIKTLKDKDLLDDRVIQRFVSEAELWVRLPAHKNITNVRLVQIIYGKPCILMNYIGGDLNTIRKWIISGRTILNITQVMDFAIQCCHGMSHIWNKLRIIHRDLKPENLLVTPEKILKITDLGLANCGAIFAGTPAYMSPEQFVDSGNLDTSSDIYSFGVILFEMLTGSRPFYGENWQEYKDKHFNEIPPDITKLNSLVSLGLQSIMSRCLQKNPEKRFRNFTDLGKELERMYHLVSGSVYRSRFTTESYLQEMSNKWDRQLKVKRIDGFSAGEWEQKGDSFAQLGKFEEAIQAYDKALLLDSNNAGVWNSKGMVLVCLGQGKETLDCYDKALTILEGKANFPPDVNTIVPILGNKASLLDDLGRFEEAIECYDKTLEMTKECIYEYRPILLNNKALSLHHLGKDRGALEIYNEIIENFPNYSNIEMTWSNKGASLHALGRNDEAIECFSKALQTNPRYSQGWFEKGRFLMDLKQLREALACFDRALELISSPDLIREYRKYRQICLSRLGEKREDIL